MTEPILRLQRASHVPLSLHGMDHQLRGKHIQPLLKYTQDRKDQQSAACIDGQADVDLESHDRSAAVTSLRCPVAVAMKQVRSERTLSLPLSIVSVMDKTTGSLNLAFALESLPATLHLPGAQLTHRHVAAGPHGAVLLQMTASQLPPV